MGTWLYRIAYNTCLDELRRRRPVTQMDEAFDPPSIEPGPAELTMADMEAAELLGRLSPTLRAALMLVDGYGFDYEDASLVLEVPHGTIASRVSRARHRLRQGDVMPALEAAEEAA